MFRECISKILGSLSIKQIMLVGRLYFTEIRVLSLTDDVFNINICSKYKVYVILILILNFSL